MQRERKLEIRMEADAFRAKCNVGRYGIIDIFKECGRQGYKLVRYPLGQEEKLGFILKKDKDTIIFINSSIRLARQIFTLAHEFGHSILHFAEESTFVDDGFTIGEKTSEIKEQEANYFAACLLMPEEEVRKYLDLELQDFSEKGLNAMNIAKVMSEFNVSFEMALNRLCTLGIIDTNEKTRLDNEKVQFHVGNLLKRVGGNSKLNLPSDEIDIPSEYLEYVIYNYNHNAIPVETLKRVLQYYKLTMGDIEDKLICNTSKDDRSLEELIKEVHD